MATVLSTTAMIQESNGLQTSVMAPAEHEWTRLNFETTAEGT